MKHRLAKAYGWTFRETDEALFDEVMIASILIAEDEQTNFELVKKWFSLFTSK